jgi:hypothetical protein
MKNRSIKKRGSRKNRTLKNTKKSSSKLYKITYKKSLPFKFTKENIESAAKLANDNIGKKVLEPSEFYKTFMTTVDVFFNQNKEYQSQLKDLKRGISNGKKLHWTVWKISPNYMFSLHEHPNIEFAYMIDGELYEKRLGSIVKKHSDLPKDDKNNWIYRKNMKNDVLVNPVGSVHIDVTKGKKPTYMLILWSGKELNYTKKQYPLGVDKFVKENSV